MMLGGYPLEYIIQCESMHFITGCIFFLIASSVAYWLFSWVSTTSGLIGAGRLIRSLSLSLGFCAAFTSHWLADAYSWGF